MICRVDIPKRLKIPTSELGKDQFGTVIAVWHNTIQVRWDDGSLGNYTIIKHVLIGE